LWDWQSGKLLRMFRHADEVNDVAFSDSDRQVITVSADRTARVWELVTGRELGPPVTLSGFGLTIDTTPDGKRAVVGTNGHFINLISPSGSAVADALPLAQLSLRNAASEDSEQLVKVAEVVSGQVLRADGVIENLSAPVWQDKWAQLKQIDLKPYFAMSMPATMRTVPEQPVTDTAAAPPAAPPRSSVDVAKLLKAFDDAHWSAPAVKRGWRAFAEASFAQKKGQALVDHWTYVWRMLASKEDHNSFPIDEACGYVAASMLMNGQEEAAWGFIRDSALRHPDWFFGLISCASIYDAAVALLTYGPGDASNQEKEALRWTQRGVDLLNKSAANQQLVNVCMRAGLTRLLLRHQKYGEAEQMWRKRWDAFRGSQRTSDAREARDQLAAVLFTAGESQKLNSLMDMNSPAVESAVWHGNQTATIDARGLAGLAELLENRRQAHARNELDNEDRSLMDIASDMGWDPAAAQPQEIQTILESARYCLLDLDTQLSVGARAAAKIALIARFQNKVAGGK
jgi:hypothetical protein